MMNAQQQPKEAIKGILLFGFIFFALAMLIINPMQQQTYEEQQRYITDRIALEQTICDNCLGSLYQYYSTTSRYQTNEYAIYVFNTIDDNYLKNLSQSITKDVQYGIEQINKIGTYIHSFHYKDDLEIHNVSEYPQFPIETIYLGTGDCEDFAILGASLLSQLGYDTCLIRIPDHMLIGVNITDISLAWTEHYYGNYYPLDSTSDTKLGYCPTYNKDPISIEPITATGKPVLIMKWNNITKETLLLSDTFYINISVFNYGSTPANNVSINVYATNTRQYYFQKYTMQTIQPNMETIMKGVFSIPKDDYYVNTELWYDGKLIQTIGNTSTLTITTTEIMRRMG